MAHRISDIYPGERPTARLRQKGTAALSAAELLSIVANEGDLELIDDALTLAGGLTGLAKAEQIAGLSPRQVDSIQAAFELGRRLAGDWPTGRWKVRAPRDLADRLIVQMGHLEREELRVVLLNAKNDVLRIETVYQGNVSASLVRVGELFRTAIKISAAGIILVHNHPSGDPTPSPDDLHLTAEAIAAGRLLDLEVLDHLVIGHDSYVSLRDRGVSFDRTPGRPA
jgi:DNA repair protein RadC